MLNQSQLNATCIRSTLPNPFIYEYEDAWATIGNESHKRINSFGGYRQQMFITEYFFSYFHNESKREQDDLFLAPGTSSLMGKEAISGKSMSVNSFKELTDGSTLQKPIQTTYWEFSSCSLDYYSLSRNYMAHWLSNFKMLINQISCFADQSYYDEYEEFHPASPAAVHDSIAVLHQMPIGILPPKAELIGDSSIAFIWCSADMIGGFRLTGNHNVSCYLRDGQALLSKESFAITDTKKIISNVRKINNIFLGYGD